MLVTKVRLSPKRMLGSIRGTVTRSVVPRDPAPAVRAASSRAGSIFLKEPTVKRYI
jgi:hypothetical protein